jgi:hypothetical protein
MRCFPRESQLLGLERSTSRSFSAYCFIRRIITQPGLGLCTRAGVGTGVVNEPNVC